MPSTTRRRLVFTATGLTALAAGGWLARERLAPRPTTAPAPTASNAAVPDTLWAQSFDTPDGSRLQLSTHRGHPIVLNFWATWCPPCVKELPTLDRFHREYSARGWQVIGLAIDSPTPVREFLAKTPVAFPVGLAGLDGTELSQALGNRQGGLPFTVVLGSDGQIKARKLGPCEFADLAGWAQQSS